MTVDRRWSAFWLALGLVAAAGEAAALAVDGSRDSLSAQVWYVLDLSPWVWSVSVAIFAGGAAWLAVHFFGHRRSRDG